MDKTNFYRAADIYSQTKTKSRPARRGLLPIKRTRFYDLLKQGRFPKPDAKIGDTSLWSGTLLQSVLLMDQVNEKDTDKTSD